MKKIEEVITRWCCQPEDLQPAQGSKWNRGVPDRVICKHCGQLFEIHTFTDAAGSTDWNYREIEK